MYAGKYVIIPYIILRNSSTFELLRFDYFDNIDYTMFSNWYKLANFCLLFFLYMLCLSINITVGSLL